MEFELGSETESVSVNVNKPLTKNMSLANMTTNEIHT